MAVTLYPYWHQDCWVFDDQRTDLVQEAFVLGISEMISRMVERKRIPAPRQGFALTFAAEPFEGHDAVVAWQRPGGDANHEMGGNWYAGEIAGEWMEGWLCPALFKYFPAAPDRIYVRCEPLPAGVNPRWDRRPGEGMRFVGPEGPGRN